VPAGCGRSRAPGSRPPLDPLSPARRLSAGFHDGYSRQAPAWLLRTPRIVRDEVAAEGSLRPASRTGLRRRAPTAAADRHDHCGSRRLLDGVSAAAVSVGRPAALDGWSRCDSQQLTVARASFAARSPRPVAVVASRAWHRWTQTAGGARRRRGTGRQPTCEHADFSDAGRRAQRPFRVDFALRDP
jgi:hypothetical protein